VLDEGPHNLENVTLYASISTMLCWMVTVLIDALFDGASQHGRRSHVLCVLRGDQPINWICKGYGEHQRLPFIGAW